MDKSQIFSGIGHAVVLTWIVLGDWLFAPKELPPPDVVQVSMVSSSDLQAMMDAAPKTEKPPADEPVVEPAVTPPEPVQPELPAEPAAADPAPAEPAPPVEVPPEVPVAADPQPIEAPPPVAPLAEEAQPVPVPESVKPPKPRPVDRVTELPVESPVKAPEEADKVMPEVSDQPAPDAPVVPEKEEPAAPKEATTEVVTEVNKAEDAPQLAPTKSLRPRTRPEAPVEPVEVAEDTSAADAQAKADAEAKKQADAKKKADDEAAADAKDAEAEAIAAALAAASAEPADTGGAQDVPEGPPMSQSEIEGLHVAINKCWNVGTMSTDALNTTIQIRVEMGEDGKPDYAEHQDDGLFGRHRGCGANRVYGCAQGSHAVWSRGLSTRSSEIWAMECLEHDL